MSRIKIIAEAGVNHNGSLELALQLVDAAVDAGADIVKFQTFKAAKLATAEAKQADYQSRNIGTTESQLSMLARLELSYNDHLKLVKYCAEKEIEFLSTAFETESLEFLIRKIGVKTLKIPSGEITNAPFLLQHAGAGCDLILSTGMASLAEIERALGVIAFGLTSNTNDLTGAEDFEHAYASAKGQAAIKSKVTLLHCTTEYPAPFDEINLRAMEAIKHAFNLPVGYSDHSEGISIPIAAAALEAAVIEKHFTLDRTMEGPDHRASLEPSELTEMVNSIRTIEKALGRKVKAPTASEIKNKPIVRKSLVVIEALRAGDMFSSANLGVKRPGSGLSPFKYWDVIGSIAKRDYVEGELLDAELVQKISKKGTQVSD